MKLKITWLFVACSCAFLAVGLSRLPSRADEPVSVRSTMEPYHEFTLTGTRKITTEKFKDYQIIDEKIFAKDPEAPTTTWRSEHHVIYETLKGDRLKSAMSVENANASHFITKEIQGNLSWRDISGDSTVVICNDVTHRAGLHFVDNTLIRTNGEGLVFATGFRTTRNPDKGTRYQQLSAAGGHVDWTDVYSQPKDETGCSEPKFPFQLLREKPLLP